jgi:peptide chain release factor 2
LITSGGIFDVEGKKKVLEDIEKDIGKTEFWDDQDNSQKVLKERTRLQNIVTNAEDCRSVLGDLDAFMELSAEGEDVDSELASELVKLEKNMEKTELQTLLSGDHDSCSAIITIHPGAGGTESQDWADMLLRMYLRWAESNGYKRELTDYQAGEEAGLKSATLIVEGENAYGYLSSEIGVHRLVRISPYDTASRRHTSFASVFVTPEIEDDVEVEIEDKDLRIDTYRSSGAGGQHVNVTDSAVRITHLPTNTVVQCQNERSQHRNKDVAMKVLRSKLYELEVQKRRDQLQEVEDGKSEIGWGSQIRSYVLHPYRMVKDHRTDFVKGDVDSVLDGDLEEFIVSYLKEKSRRKQKK